MGPHLFPDSSTEKLCGATISNLKDRFRESSGNKKTKQNLKKTKNRLIKEKENTSSIWKFLKIKNALNLV